VTRRETEVLAYMAIGLSDRQIARALDLSPYTVKNHAKSVYRKLRAANRAHAVAIGLRAGVIA